MVFSSMNGAEVGNTQGECFRLKRVLGRHTHDAKASADAALFHPVDKNQSDDGETVS
jgi:hypothetical protein